MQATEMKGTFEFNDRNLDIEASAVANQGEGGQ